MHIGAEPNRLASPTPHTPADKCRGIEALQQAIALVRRSMHRRAAQHDRLLLARRQQPKAGGSGTESVVDAL
jgi:hypothetical protein